MASSDTSVTSSFASGRSDAVETSEREPTRACATRGHRLEVDGSADQRKERQMTLATETGGEALIRQDARAELKWDARISDTGRLEPCAGGACVLTLCLDLARARKVRHGHLARFDELVEGTLA